MDAALDEVRLQLKKVEDEIARIQALSEDNAQRVRLGELEKQRTLLVGGLVSLLQAQAGATAQASTAPPGATGNGNMVKFMVVAGVLALAVGRPAYAMKGAAEQASAFLSARGYPPQGSKAAACGAWKW
uniref:Uncharacterized protein n=1 Tax=Chlamydomonas leiostraca TaxID=1034604 RepID=A0A7S0RIA8_9CHLO|mmetsp:Transcript_23234/g.59348  ORF Transcript_23234/g.59348 Transcript_23234/m.59348 type:complete len:129 (+) Transcript_23234:41-427(+)